MTEEARAIVEALRHLGNPVDVALADCSSCPMQDYPHTMAVECGESCPGVLMLMAADLIEHLSSVAEKASTKAALCEKVMEDYDKMRRERDAAVDDIELGVCCETCKHDDGVFCVECARVASRGNWEWRGVHENA
jgi:hypothetical protein